MIGLLGHKLSQHKEWGSMVYGQKHTAAAQNNQVHRWQHHQHTQKGVIFFKTFISSEPVCIHKFLHDGSELLMVWKFLFIIYKRRAKLYKLFKVAVSPISSISRYHCQSNRHFVHSYWLSWRKNIFQCWSCTIYEFTHAICKMTIILYMKSPLCYNSMSIDLCIWHCSECLVEYDYECHECCEFLSFWVTVY